jgi:PAS domain S-box-containing protein
VTTQTSSATNVTLPLHALFEAMSDGVLIIDAAGVRTYANPALTELVGCDPREPLGSAEVPPWIPEDQRTRYRDYVGDGSRAVRSATIALEWAVLNAEGERIPVVLRLLPVRASMGSPAATLWMVQPEAPIAPATEAAVGRVHLLEKGLERIAADLARLGFAGNGAPKPPAGFPGAERLSPRESEIVGLLLEGHRVVSISTELCVSEHTVRNHLKSVFRKLGVHSQAELVRVARNGSS